jgi:nucleotide-binding universal stress UspA family protein
MLFRQILVPVDYSDASLAALRVAADLAERFGATLDIVHVWDRPTYISDAVLVGHGQSQRPLGDLIKENAERDMREFLTKVALPAGVSRRERLISGDPASALLKDIEQGSSELVVVGTHGRTGLSHLLLGSVAEKLVRLSPLPVLTVPVGRTASSA